MQFGTIIIKVRTLVSGVAVSEGANLNFSLWGGGGGAASSPLLEEKVHRKKADR